MDKDSINEMARAFLYVPYYQYRLPAQRLEAEFCLIIIKLKRQQDKTATSNMKKILLSIILIILFVGCSKDENNQDSLNIPSNVSVKVDSSFNLGSVQSWVSSNTFVAEITQEGVITGKHVGNCTVNCSDASCSVTVTANNTLYEEPITDWGISKSELISRKGQPDRESGNTLIYETGNSAAPYEMYTVKNGILETSAVLVLSSYTSSMTDHILDRYYPVYYDDDYYYFANAYTLSDASIVVVAGLSDNAQYWLVMYMDYSSAKTVSSIDVRELMKML